MHLIHKIQLAACQATDLLIHSHIVKSQRNLMQHKYYISFQCKWIAPKWIYNQHLANKFLAWEKQSLKSAQISDWISDEKHLPNHKEGSVLTIILKKHIEKHFQSLCLLKCGNLLFIIIIIISTLMAFIYLDWIWF